MTDYGGIIDGLALGHILFFFLLLAVGYMVTSDKGEDK